MKKILIYKDEGADAFGVSSLLFTLKQNTVDTKYCIELVDRNLFQDTTWYKQTQLLIFPGGRDIPYHEALKGPGNCNIRDFVEKGGNFLGICAGGYYGCSSIEFEHGGPLEVVAERELKFFPGVARGPAYGLGKFKYRSEQGSQIANLTLSSTRSAAYYNGGCLFVDADKYDNVSVIARYEDIDEQPAAIIKCRVGAGCVILSGVHPEYSAWHESTEKRTKGSLFLSLKQIEKERLLLFSAILSHLDISLVKSQ